MFSQKALTEYTQQILKPASSPIDVSRKVLLHSVLPYSELQSNLPVAPQPYMQRLIFNMCKNNVFKIDKLRGRAKT